MLFEIRKSSVSAHWFFVSDLDAYLKGVGATRDNLSERTPLTGDAGSIRYYQVRLY